MACNNLRKRVIEHINLKKKRCRKAAMIAKLVLQFDNDAQKKEQVEVEARLATARRAAEDPRIFISYADLPPDVLKKFPQLGKDATSTIVVPRNVISQMLSVDINLAYELSNMTPEEIDMNPDLLYSRIPIKDLLVQRLQKSLYGKAMEYIAGATPQVVERQVIQTQPIAKGEESLKDKILSMFGGKKNVKGLEMLE